MSKHSETSRCFSSFCRHEGLGRDSGHRSFGSASYRIAWHPRQRGFSLVELMVAITIGSIIILAISVLFSQITKGYRTTDNSSRAMENGNFALRALGEDLRMVGFIGMSSDPSIVFPAKAYDIDKNCSADSNWPFLPKPGIEKVDDVTTLTCIDADAIVSGSPAIIVRHATGMETRPADLVENNGFFVQTGGGGGLVFQGNDYAGEIKGAGRQSLVCGDSLCATAAEAPIFAYDVSVYYIRRCSRESGGVCPPNDEGPTLVRVQLDNSAKPSFVETPIASGVERFRVVFFDENGAEATNPESAILARISMLVRTGREASHDDSASTYVFADGTTFNCGDAGSEACKFRYFMYTDTVVLKNFDFRR